MVKIIGSFTPSGSEAGSNVENSKRFKIFLFKIFSELLHEFGRLSRLWILMILDVPLALQIKTRISFTYSDT